MISMEKKYKEPKIFFKNFRFPFEIFFNEHNIGKLAVDNTLS